MLFSCSCFHVDMLRYNVMILSAGMISHLWYKLDVYVPQPIKSISSMRQFTHGYISGVPSSGGCVLTLLLYN